MNNLNKKSKTLLLIFVPAGLLIICLVCILSITLLFLAPDNKDEDNFGFEEGEIGNDSYRGGYEEENPELPVIEIEEDKEVEDKPQDEEVVIEKETPKSNLSTQVTADDPIIGNFEPGQKVIIEFSDLECPFCQMYHEDTFPQIKQNYVDTGEFSYVTKNFPLSSYAPASDNAAYVSECVNQLGGDQQFYEFVDAYYSVTQSSGNGLSGGEDALISLGARYANASEQEIRECMKSEFTLMQIEVDKESGMADGIAGVPYFIVGTISSDSYIIGGEVVGASSYDSFKDTLDNF